MKIFIKYPVLFFIAYVFTGCSSPMAQNILAEADFSKENIKTLEIKGGFCNVELKGNTGNSLKFSGYIKGNGNADKYEIMYDENNGYLKVWVEYPNNVWGNISSLLKFDVPANVVVIVDNSSGNVEAEKLIGQSVHLETSSGNVYASDIQASLEIKCSSGNIDLSNQKGALSAKASSGNIKITEVEGSVMSKTSSGNIQVYSVQGDVSAECTSGNIRLKDITGKLYAEASSGNISGKEIRLTDESRFKASSGNITIELLNDKDELSFDLDAGSGNLYAVGNSSDDRLILKKGAIKILGISSSGNQRYSTLH